MFVTNSSYAHTFQVTLILNAVFYKEPTYNGLPYPQWAKSLGWLIVMFPISTIILWFCYYYCKKGGFRVSILTVSDNKDIVIYQ